jgi:hypothetical protein
LRDLRYCPSAAPPIAARPAAGLPPLAFPALATIVRQLKGLGGGGELADALGPGPETAVLGARLGVGKVVLLTAGAGPGGVVSGAVVVRGTPESPGVVVTAPGVGSTGVVSIGKGAAVCAAWSGRVAVPGS